MHNSDFGKTIKNIDNRVEIKLFINKEKS